MATERLCYDLLENSIIKPLVDDIVLEYKQKKSFFKDIDYKQKNIYINPILEGNVYDDAKSFHFTCKFIKD